MARVLVLVALLMLAAPAAARAAEPPPGTEWTEHYFPSSDGTMLHADVLRPVRADGHTPVLLTVSPYTNHAGDTTYAARSGPSERFYDFLAEGQVFDRGYTYVMVDLRGTGGSAGCNDWGGPGERMDAKAAVEWAAAQPWSTGRVGMIGKSYDGWTGLMAIAERPAGLAAVLSMEPVYSGYRYLYMDGVRFVNSVATPASFTQIDAMPGSTGDSVEYHLNGNGVNAACYAGNISQQQQDDPTVDFWRARDLIGPARGTTTPLFLTQGFLETNTKPDGAFAFFSGMAGPKRAWFGQFDHVRGWEKTDDGEFATGRSGFIEEAMRFLDHHVKGVPTSEAPTDRDAPVVVQAIDGRYRAERSWPPADARLLASALRSGSYQDDGSNSGTGAGAGKGLWSISQPLPHDAHLAGEPVVELDVDATPRANLVVNVYDIAPDGTATMISRGAMLIRASGRVRPEMYGQDWPIAAGHRIGVLVSGANAEWWEHVPTRTEVDVLGGTIALPFLRHVRPAHLDGAAAPRLRAYLENAPFELAADVVAGAHATFALPEALVPAPAPAPRRVGPASPVRPARLTVRAVRRGRAVTVSGRACGRVRIALLRARRTITRRSALPRRSHCGAYRARIVTRARGRLTVRVTAADGTRRSTRVRNL